MKQGELIAWAKRNGFTVDKYGHLIKGDTRLKLSSVAARYEVKHDVCGKNEWLRLKSNYFSKLSLSADDKLQGMKR